MKTDLVIFWFRRDLRLHDNAGLYHALRSGYPVLPLFIFDTAILDDLTDKNDKRLCFIWDALDKMQQQLVAIGSSLCIMHDTPARAFKKLTTAYSIKGVYTNTDYEPYASKRDGDIAEQIDEHGISFLSFKDQVIFEKEEIVKDDQTPYQVYTPYSKRWKSTLTDFYLKPYPTEKYFDHFVKHEAAEMPSLQSLGFNRVPYDVVSPQLDHSIAKTYHDTRNTPGIHGTTRLSVHLRFGTVSIRHSAAQCLAINDKLLNELIWREFFMMILWHYPHTVNNAFKPAYDNIKWRYNEADFQKWCAGETGYTMVDAGMRELNETGFMHNRVRMITASFLCKHLLIDWRWGEAYFAQKLLDYDMAQNVGNWQWVAGSGVDAAPYFRIFNPITQAQKFDKDQQYAAQWVPEKDELTYRHMIEHNAARKRCLAAYAVVKDAKDKITKSDFEKD